MFPSAYWKISLFLHQSLVCFADLVKEVFSPLYGTYSEKTTKIPPNKIQVPSLTFCCHYRVGQNKIFFELGDFEKGKRCWSPLKDANPPSMILCLHSLGGKNKFFFGYCDHNVLGKFIKFLHNKMQILSLPEIWFSIMQEIWQVKELLKSLETKCKSLVVLEQRKTEN